MRPAVDGRPNQTSSSAGRIVLIRSCVPQPTSMLMCRIRRLASYGFGKKPSLSPQCLAENDWPDASSLVVVGNFLDQLNDGLPQTIMIKFARMLATADWHAAWRADQRSTACRYPPFH